MGLSWSFRALTDRALAAATGMAFLGVVLAGCNRNPKPVRAPESNVTPGPALAAADRPSEEPPKFDWKLPLQFGAANGSPPASSIPVPSIAPMPPMSQPPPVMMPPPMYQPPPVMMPPPPARGAPFGNQGQGQGIVGLGGGAPGGYRPPPRPNNFIGGGMMGGGLPAGGGATAKTKSQGARKEAYKSAPTDPVASGEKYGRHHENEFRSPKVAALSTFSADVNTASYSNVRRFLLDEKRLPPKDSVYLAEFVNYFPYAYAKPANDDPIAFHLELGPCPWNSSHHLLRIGVQARTIDARKMPPRNLVFLIDTSGSMGSANKLPLLQQSLGLLIETLTGNDLVSIVTYAGDSRVALAPTKGSEKKTIRDAVNGLSSGGSTNGEGGIKTAYDLASRTFLAGGVNRVILCTDGDFNVGATDQADLVRMIEDRRRSQVFLTILGYGMGNYQDEVLKELANHGNGHHAYIDTIDEAKKVFVEQGGALACVAKDVKFQVEFNPAKVAGYRLLGYENRLLKDEDFKSDAKDAGDLGSGHQVTVLYEIAPPEAKPNLPGVDPLKYQPSAAAAPSDEWLTVKMRYKHPDAETSKELVQALTGEVRKDPSEDYRFAAAMASFAQLLRNSPQKGVMTFDNVLAMARRSLGDDPNGHRTASLELVKKAMSLSHTPPKVQGAAQN